MGSLFVGDGNVCPFLPFVDDVQVVFDVGANSGAATVDFAHHYPGALIHSFESRSEYAARLEHAVNDCTNVRVHPVRSRSVGAWATEHRIERIDLLKLDAEACEADVLDDLASVLPGVKVLYVQYASRRGRRRIARLVDETHELYTGVMFLDRGECVYLATELVDLEAAMHHLRRNFMAARAR